jgi:hypothetical protein
MGPFVTAGALIFYGHSPPLAREFEPVRSIVLVFEGVAA